MRGVVAADNLEGAVGQAFNDRGAIGGGTQRGIHFEIRVVGRPAGPPRGPAGHDFPAVGAPELPASRQHGVGQGEVMGAGFAGDGDAAFFGLAQQLHAARRTHMLAMHLRPGQLRPAGYCARRSIPRPKPASRASQGPRSSILRASRRRSRWNNPGNDP